MIVLDYRDRRPIYEQLTDKLAELMLQGILKENEQLPSVRSLATELSINPNTIQRAYAELERQGLTYSVKGRGSFVSENSMIREKRIKEVLASFETAVELAVKADIAKDRLLELISKKYEEATK